MCMFSEKDKPTEARKEMKKSLKDFVMAAFDFFCSHSNEYKFLSYPKQRYLLKAAKKDNLFPRRVAYLDSLYKPLLQDPLYVLQDI